MTFDRIDMKALEEDLVRIRRDLHKHPETAWTEYRTTALIISELEKLLLQQQASRPQVVVNNYNFFMLSVPRTRAYVDNLGNDGRQFVGHMLHQTMLEDTPRSVMDQVDEMTRLRDYQEGGVVIQHNSGPVNGNIGTQNVGMPGMNDENSLNQLEQHG